MRIMEAAVGEGGVWTERKIKKEERKKVEGFYLLLRPWRIRCCQS